MKKKRSGDKNKKYILHHKNTMILEEKLSEEIPPDFVYEYL